MSGRADRPAAAAFASAVEAVVAWRREAACNPVEYERRTQVLRRLEAIASEVLGADDARLKS